MRTRIRYHFTDYRTCMYRREYFTPDGRCWRVDEWQPKPGGPSMSGAISSIIIDDPAPLPLGNPMAERSVEHCRYDNPLSQGGYAVYTHSLGDGFGYAKTYLKQQGCGAPWATHIGSVNLDSSPMWSACLRSCKGDMPQDETVNVFEFFSDLHSVDQAAELLSGAGKSILHLLRSMGSKYSSKRIGGILGSSSELWLQVQLVLRPFLSDLHNFTHMAEHVQRNLSNLAIRNSMKWFKVQSTGSARGTEVHPDGHTRASTTRRDILTLRASGYYEISDAAASLMMLQSFGLLTPLTSAWEALTLSFVVDYFVDIRNRIASLENKLRDAFPPVKVGAFQVLGGSYSTKLTTQVVSYDRIDSSDPVLWVPMGKFTNTQYTRNALGNPDLSEPTLNEAGLTRNRLTNIGALIITAKLR